MRQQREAFGQRHEEAKERLTRHVAGGVRSLGRDFLRCRSRRCCIAGALADSEEWEDGDAGVPGRKRRRERCNQKQRTQGKSRSKRAAASHRSGEVLDSGRRACRVVAVEHSLISSACAIQGLSVYPAASHARARRAPERTGCLVRLSCCAVHPGCRVQHRRCVVSETRMVCRTPGKRLLHHRRRSTASPTARMPDVGRPARTTRRAALQIANAHRAARSSTNTSTLRVPTAVPPTDTCPFFAVLAPRAATSPCV